MIGSVTHRSSPRCLLIPVLLLVLFELSVPAAEPAGAIGHWRGRLSFREADLPLRIDIRSGEDGALSAELDIPSLLMAWEPIPVEAEDGGVRITLPFGLGDVSVAVEPRTAAGSKELGTDLLELRLERGAPPPIVRETVRFRSGDTELVGEMVRPGGEGPFPGVVLLHGSGRQDRKNWAYRSWAELLVSEGHVVLYYDKRGVGDSGGEYGAGFRQLAADGRAAVEYLRGSPRVDPERVGLQAWSQGCWLAESIAAEGKDIAFLILVSAAAGTPRDQELQKIEHGMRNDGRAEAEIEDALAYAGLYFYVVRTGEGWPLLETAVERARGAPWGQYVDQPRSAEDLAWWRENHALQPADLVDGLDLPVLLLYGGADWITPPVENAEKLRSLFPSPERVSVHVYDRADHRLEVPAGRDAAGRWRWPGVGEGLRETVAAWLRECGSPGPGGTPSTATPGG